jgi:flagellar basal body-associated protein FliL
MCAALWLPGRVPRDPVAIIRRLKEETFMSSEIIVVLVMVALALAGLGYLEMNSRRNKAREEQEKRSDE